MEFVGIAHETDAHEAREYCTAFLKAGDELFKRHLNAEDGENLLNEALDEYAKALELTPDAPEIMARMARVSLRQGNYVRAEKQAVKALNGLKSQAKPDRNVIFVANAVLGSIRSSQGEYRQAEEYLQRALKAGGAATTKLRLLMSHCRRELARGEKKPLRKLGGLVQATSFFMSALVLLPFEQERMTLKQMLEVVPTMLAAYYLEEFNMAERALGLYLDLHQKYPGLACVSNTIGDLWRLKGENEKARYWFDKTIARHPAHIDAHYQLARILEQREDHEGVGSVYRKLLSLRPNDAHLHCNMGNACYNLGSYKAALAHYETALHLGTDPQWRALLAQSIGNIHSDIDDNVEAAISAYQMAVLLNPDDADSHIHLGLLYFQKQDYDNAELVYKKAMAISPENPRLYSNMGYLRWMEGDIDSAVNYYEKAIALDASYEIPLNNLGVIHLDTLGDVRRAVTLFERAININESYALAYYNLGRAHSFLGERMEAATCFQTAQLLNETTHELDSEELTERINALFNSSEQ